MTSQNRIDVLEYLLPDPAWAQENHLATSGAQSMPIFVSLLGHFIWEMKSAAGYPWDGNFFDEEYIYQSITEYNWTDPTAFKMFASSSWPGANGGIVWMPRWITLGQFTPPIVTADSSYRIYPGDGKPYIPDTLGGPIETHVEGPFEGEYAIDFGGSLGKAQSSIRQVYKWGPGYVNMEVNHYAKGFGRVCWQLWTLVNGLYQLKQESLFNSIVAGGVPALDFPQSVPVITK